MAVQTARESRMCSGAVPPLSRPQTAPNECGKKGEKTVFEIFFAHSVLLHEKKGEKKKKKKKVSKPCPQSRFYFKLKKSSDTCDFFWDSPMNGVGSAGS
jgi:hypothetical protein